MELIMNMLASTLNSYATELLTRNQAAQYLGVTPNTLAVWACTHRYNLPFVKIGRLVKYRRADLEDFIARRTIATADCEK
jgi:excisionase family DNA binding protein